MYNSGYQVNNALNHLDELQDKLQDLYDDLSLAVINGRHSKNIDNLESILTRTIQMREVAHYALTSVKEDIQDVLSAEKQFLEEND